MYLHLSTHPRKNPRKILFFSRAAGARARAARAPIRRARV
jgi:hypothetical protein